MTSVSLGGLAADWAASLAVHFGTGRRGDLWYGFFANLDHDGRRKPMLTTHVAGVHLGAGKHIIFLKNPVLYIKVNRLQFPVYCRPDILLTKNLSRDSS